MSTPDRWCGFYWAPIPQTALEDKNLRGRHYRLLAHLASFWIQRNECFQSQKTLANIIGCSRTTLQKTIYELEEAGYVRVVGAFDRSSRKRIVNTYQPGYRSLDTAQTKTAQIIDVAP